MHLITTSINQAIAQENWFSALFMSLSLPGMCGHVEYGDGVESEIYSQWFDNYLGPSYQNLLKGYDCYLIHQACLYKQLDHIHQEVVERFHFILPGTSQIAHKSLIEGVLQLHIDAFCLEVTQAFEQWQLKIDDAVELQKRLEHRTTVHKRLLTVSPA